MLTAWSAFQSAHWRGQMSILFAQAGATRTESVRLSDEANRQALVDVGLFTQYVDALAAGDEALADFYRARFPDRLGVAVDAWLATDPLTSDQAPATPFDLPEYVLEEADEAARLQAQADDRTAEAREANEQGDRYTLMSIFLATVLLLAALAGKTRRSWMQLALLVTAAVLFVGTAAVIATFPFEF